jgi:hypothetical protein
VVPLDQLEKQAILQAVDACGGNRTQAARLLGISVRTMRNKLREYGVAPGGSDSGSDDGEGAADEVAVCSSTGSSTGSSAGSNGSSNPSDSNLGHST